MYVRGVIWKPRDMSNKPTVHRGLRRGTPCTIDPSSLGARRCLGHDATDTTQQGC